MCVCVGCVHGRVGPHACLLCIFDGTQVYASVCIILCSSFFHCTHNTHVCVCMWHLCIYIYTHIYIYIYIRIHTYLITEYIHNIPYHTIPYHTIPYHTLHYITLHYITLHYIALHCIALHCIALHCITLHYITLHYITLHYITLHYITYIHTHTSVPTYIHIHLRSPKHVFPALHTYQPHTLLDPHHLSCRLIFHYLLSLSVSQVSKAWVLKAVSPLHPCILLRI